MIKKISVLALFALYFICFVSADLYTNVNEINIDESIIITIESNEYDADIYFYRVGSNDYYHVLDLQCDLICTESQSFNYLIREDIFSSGDYVLKIFSHEDNEWYSTNLKITPKEIEEIDPVVEEETIPEIVEPIVEEETIPEIVEIIMEDEFIPGSEELADNEEVFIMTSPSTKISCNSKDQGCFFNSNCCEGLDCSWFTCSDCNHEDDGCLTNGNCCEGVGGCHMFECGLREEGESCLSNDACLGDLRCNWASCKSPRLSGEACSFNNQCGSNNCAWKSTGWWVWQGRYQCH